MIHRLQLFTVASLELHTDILSDAWAATGVAQRLQSEGGLQLKMLHALKQAHLRGHSQALVAGTDAPTLPVAHLQQLLASLADVALGPTEDGGFYAIACRRTHRAMFEDVEWSSPLTLEHTVRSIERAGLTVELGPRWFDVDEPPDLERLAASAGLPDRTARWFQQRKIKRQYPFAPHPTH